MLSSKSSKYLFCRYNDFLQMRNLEMWLIRHMKATQDYEGFLEIQNRDWSCFIGKSIAVTEVLSKTDLSEKETKIVKEMTKNYKICILFFLLNVCCLERRDRME